jgi:hypothetical protein
MLEFMGLGARGFLRFISGYQSTFLQDDLVIEALRKGDSLIRWGDGETALARGKNIPYQEGNEELKRLLRDCLSLSSPNIIFGLPWAFTTSILDNRWNLRFIRIFLSTRIFLDRFLTRDTLRHTDTEFWYRNFPNIPALLHDLSLKKTPVLISGNREFLKVCPSHTIFIEVEKLNSFKSFNATCTRVSNLRAEHGELVVFLAAGPMSKPIVAQFHQTTQCVDIGHGFDFYLRGFKKYAWT